MSLTLFYHPLASFCWKVQIALYENDTPFTSSIVNLGDKASSAQFFSLAPMGKMPVVRDEQRNRTVPETSIIIEYLDRHHPGQRTRTGALVNVASRRAKAAPDTSHGCPARVSATSS